MAETSDQTVQELRQELAELQVALLRKRSEVSNLKVGFIRAVSGASPIPSDPLSRNLVAARTELTELERRLAEVQLAVNEAEGASGGS